MIVEDLAFILVRAVEYQAVFSIVLNYVVRNIPGLFSFQSFFVADDFHKACVDKGLDKLVVNFSFIWVFLEASFVPLQVLHDGFLSSSEFVVVFGAK